MSLGKLPPELHCRITEFLPLRDRQQLQKCSKALNAAHHIAPIFFTNCRFMRFSSHEDDPKFVSIYFDDLELQFYDRDGGTDYERKRVTLYQQVTEKTVRFEGENYCDVAKRCFRDMFLKKNVSCGLFTTNFVSEETLFEYYDRISIQELLFNNFEPTDNDDRNQRIDVWLKHANPKYLKKLVVYSHDGGNCVIGSHKILQKVERFTVLPSSDIDDELLLNLTSATEVYIDESRITVDGVNKFIKNWVAKKVKKGAEFEYAPAEMSSYTLEDLVKDLRNVSFRSNEAIIPIAEDRSLHIWIRESCIRVECLRMKS